MKLPRPRAAVLFLLLQAGTEICNILGDWAAMRGGRIVGQFEMNLGDILALHELWLNTGGVDGSQADFSARGQEFWTEDDRMVILGEQQVTRLVDMIGPHDKNILSSRDLRNARFDAADLSDAQFLGCSLEGATFVGANIARTHFDRSNLSRCDFSGAAGEDPSFREANLSYANLGYASLPGASLESSNLEHCTLTDSNLSNGYLRHAKAASAFVERANLTSADLTGGDFAHAAMANAILEHAQIHNAKFDDADLFGANLSSVVGNGMSAERARMTRVRFSGCKLENAKFHDSVMQGAVFDNAHIANAVFDRADLREYSWNELQMVDEGETDEKSEKSKVGKKNLTGAERGKRAKGTRDLAGRRRMVLVARRVSPSANGAVFTNCRFFGAWINAFLLPQLATQIVRSAINVEGATVHDKGCVFIAHASEDLDAALEMYAGLVSHGLVPWIDKRDLKVGEEWKRVIPLTIERSKAVIVCLSRISIEKRGYIQNEFRLALDTLSSLPFGQVFILPVRLEECDVPVEFQGFHWVDYWNSDSLSRIVHALKEPRKDL